jgi:hypothetical protein
MKAMKISIPSATVDTPVGLEACPTCRRPINLIGRNRFLVNLLGIIDLASKNWTLREGSDWIETFREIKKCDSLGLDLVLTKEMFSKLKLIIEKEKGWGNMEQQLEVIETIDKAVEVEA